MSARELADWLKTEESKSVGWHHEGETESIGNQSGRHIIEIQRGRGRLTEDARAQCAKSSRTSSGTLRQRPHHDVEHARWRYSLMNWRHDPLKE